MSSSILVVNDDPVSLKFITRLLEEQGFEVDAFRNASDALQSFVFSRTADLVITDINMPGINGWQLCRLLRSPEYPAYNQIPILVVSGTFLGEEISQLTSESGADAFLSLPIDRKILIDTVQQLLLGRSSYSPVRVLVVEDSPTIQSMLKKIFQKHGYLVETADDKAAAREKFAGSSFGTIILDYHLPDGKGDELLVEFSSRRPDVVYIMITMDPRPDLAVSWIQAGASAYVRKPLDPEYVVTLCRNARREKALLGSVHTLEARTEDLVKREAFFQAVMKSTSVFTFAFDARGICTILEGRELPILPFPWAQFLGQSVYALFQDYPLVVDSFRKVLLGESSMFRHSFGETNLLISCAPIVRENGQIQGAVVLAVDMTETVRLQDALRRQAEENETRFRNLFDLIPYACTVKDRQGRFVLVNDSFCRMTGYSPEEVIGKTMIELGLIDGSEDTVGLGRQLSRQMDRSGETSQVILRIKSKQGAVYEMLHSNRYIEFGHETLILSATVDITDRRRAIEQLRKSQARLKVAMNLAKMVYWEYEVSTGLFYFDDRFYHHYGTTSEKEGGHFMSPQEYCRRFVVPDSGFDLAAELDMAIRSSAPHYSRQLEHWICRADGQKQYIIVRFETVKDRGRRTVKLFGSNQDITEQKRAEEEREKTSAHLLHAQRLESIGRLAGGVAHDFNNMLGVIIGYAELALTQSPSPAALQEVLQEIHNAAGRSVELTRQLLAFARRQTVDPKVLDLNVIIPGMLKILQRLIGEDIQLHWKPGNDLWSVCIDPGQIDQIMANLLVNARDAIDGVGSVIIETGNVVIDEAHRQVRPEVDLGEYVQISVSDSGCGMGIHILENIFDPFFTTKDQGKGTGLGLATVYGIVKQNRGYVFAYSEPGQGTTFHLYLPRTNLAPDVPEVCEKPAIQGSETILIVEDEAAILRVGKTILENHGYTVLVSQIPSEALSLMEKYPDPIHLLITDIVMPEMNGRELWQKTVRLRPHIKCLFVSGYTAEVIAHHGVIEEGLEFLQKPFSIAGLTQKVREILNRP